jgi:hypothetical protein
MLNNPLAFSSDNNNNPSGYPPPQHQQQQQLHQQQQFSYANQFMPHRQTAPQYATAFSVDSTNNSVNSTSGSFLTAANTIVFNNSAGGGGGGSTGENYSYNGYNSVSSNSSFIKLYDHPGLNNSPAATFGSSEAPRPFNSHHHQQQQPSSSPSLAKLLERNSFSNTLLEMQKNQSTMEDLDFEINYTGPKKQHQQQSTTLNEQRLQDQHKQPSKRQRNSSTSHAVFKDDDNLFEEDDISIDSEFNYDEATSVNADAFMNEMSNDSTADFNNSNTSYRHQSTNARNTSNSNNNHNQSVRFLLENPLRFSKTMPIEQNTFKSDLNNNNVFNSNKSGDATGESETNGTGSKNANKFANQNSVSSSHSPTTLAGLVFFLLD